MTEEKKDIIDESQDEKKAPDTVTIPKAMFDSLVKRLDDVEKSVGVKQELVPVKYHTARMRKMDGKFIMGFAKKNWLKYNESARKDEMWCEIKLFDGKKEETREVKLMDILEFSEVVNVQIVKQSVTVDRKVQGETEIATVKDYATVGTGEMTPVVIETPIVTCIINLPGVGEVKVPVDALNI